MATIQDTSREALGSIDTEALIWKVYDQLQNSRRGLTCDQIEVALNMRHQTASARIRELREMGFIADDGNRRKTRSGRNAIVWKALFAI